MPHARQPAFGVVGGRCDPHLGPAAVDGVARQRHPVLPADQATDPPGWGSDHVEVVAGADAVEEPLMHGRHQLAMFVQQTVRPQHEQRVVERAGTLGLALVDADRAVDAVLAACLAQPLGERSRNVHRVLPETLPQGIPPRKSRCALRPRVRRVQGYEGLRQHGKLRAVGGCLADQPARLLDSGLGVENHRRRLNGRDSDRLLTHAGSRIPRCRLLFSLRYVPESARTGKGACRVVHHV